MLFICAGELQRLLYLESSHLPGTLLSRRMNVYDYPQTHGNGCGCQEP